MEASRIVLSVWPTPLAMPDRKNRPPAVCDLLLTPASDVTPPHIAQCIAALQELIRTHTATSPTEVLVSSVTARTLQPSPHVYRHLLHQTVASLHIALLPSVITQATSTQDESVPTFAIQCRAYILAFVARANLDATHEWLIPRTEWLLWCDILNVCAVTWRLMHHRAADAPMRAVLNWQRMQACTARMKTRADGSYWMSAARWARRLETCTRLVAYACIANSAAASALGSFDTDACQTLLACPLTLDSSSSSSSSTSGAAETSAGGIDWETTKTWGIVGAEWSIVETTPAPWWDTSSNVIMNGIQQTLISPAQAAQDRVREATRSIMDRVPDAASILPSTPPVTLLVDQREPTQSIIGTATINAMEAYKATLPV